jgi:hypothetical protein
MSVYVDRYRAPYGRMRMSHMIADTPDELHQMADAIGVARKWFQGQASFPHYDVCESKRQEAIRLGAVEVENRADFVAAMRRIRESGAFGEVSHRCP